jgi:hypothetical protein
MKYLMWAICLSLLLISGCNLQQYDPLNYTTINKSNDESWVFLKQRDSITVNCDIGKPVLENITVSCVE